MNMTFNPRCNSRELVKNSHYAAKQCICCKGSCSYQGLSWVFLDTSAVLYNIIRREQERIEVQVKAQILHN